MNHRRSFLKAAGASVFATSFAAGAQQSPYRVGWIAPGTRAEGLPILDALRRGLHDLGYVEGRNLVIEARWGNHSGALVDQFAVELVAWNPHVIVTLGPTAYAVRKATTTIPVVFGFSGDPVQAGFVRGFARPGGNMTGISFLALELVEKRIELLKAVVPGARRIAIVANSQHPGDQAERRASEAAARGAGLETAYFESAGAPGMENALRAIEKSGFDAVVMFPIQSIVSNSALIAAWSIRNRIPAISGWAQFADEGNLMSYGANLRETFRRIAAYAGKILEGARPDDLPVELPMHIELVINLKAARALGVTVPPAVLLRADRVIE
jgi:putative ABC transport system substrate-binding protein